MAWKKANRFCEKFEILGLINCFEYFVVLAVYRKLESQILFIACRLIKVFVHLQVFHVRNVLASQWKGKLASIFNCLTKQCHGCCSMLWLSVKSMTGRKFVCLNIQASSGSIKLENLICDLSSMLFLWPSLIKRYTSLCYGVCISHKGGSWSPGKFNM